MKNLVITFLASMFLAGTAYAEPFAQRSPPVGQMYTYTAKTEGGSGSQTRFKIPTPPDGWYLATLTANFNHQGTPAAPIQDSCWFEKDGNTIGQATVLNISAYFPGLTETVAIHVTSTTLLDADCGTTASGSWSWGSLPLQVTLVRMAGDKSGSLSSKAVSGTLSAATTGKGAGLH